MRVLHDRDCAVMERDTPVEWSATCTCGAAAAFLSGEPLTFDVTDPATPLPISAYE